MAQGKITTKDKVNIPDWVTGNAYLVNDFVINDNKFYRANGAIPANTALTIGTAGATWREMSPSAGGQFTLTGNTLSTTNGITSDRLIQSSEQVHAELWPSVATVFATADVFQTIAIDTVWASNYMLLDDTTGQISTTDIGDDATRLSITFSGTFMNTAPGTTLASHRLVVMLMASNDNGTTVWRSQEAHPLIVYPVENTTSYSFNVTWDHILHDSTMSYTIMVAAQNTNWRLMGGTMDALTSGTGDMAEALTIPNTLLSIRHVS